MTEIFVNLFLVSLLALIAIFVVRTHKLLAVVVLSGAYSLISAAIFVNLDAVDVAFTEAAVGAGISTILFLVALSNLPYEEKLSSSYNKSALLLCIVLGVVLSIAVIDLPLFGDPMAAPHQHVAPRYIEEGSTVFNIPNIVTNVLASYRSFDTLGETIVIFTAGLGVILLLTGSTLNMQITKQKRDKRKNKNGK